MALFYQQAQRRWFGTVNDILFGKPSEGFKPSEGYGSFCHCSFYQQAQRRWLGTQHDTYLIADDIISPFLEKY
jgi:hypothetical protein